jgi:hypothetical protein
MKSRVTFKPPGLKAKKWRTTGHAKGEVNLLPAKPVPPDHPNKMSDKKRAAEEAAR